MSLMKRAAPKHNCYLVARIVSEYGAFQVAEQAHELELDGIDVNAGDHVTKDLVDWLARHDMVCVVWVWRAPASNDDAETWAKMRDAGVHAFTSNLPDGIDSFITARA